MGKLWNGKIKRIEIYKLHTKDKIKEFFADDVHADGNYNTFYLSEKEIYKYDERTHYYRSFEVKE